MNIQRMFEEEVRDKKRTASGVHSRTGKRGYVGKMRMPTDCMTRKEKYNYRKAGKVFIYNMYENLMSYEEFEKLPLEEKKKAMIEYQRRHTNASIMKAWGLDTYQFYTKLLVKELGLREGSPKKKAQNKKTGKQTPVEAYLIESNNQGHPLTPMTSQAPAETIVEAPEDGFTFSLKGSYTAEALIKKFDKLGLLLDGEESEFQITLKIKEKN